MTTETDNEGSSSEGGMSEHLQRYRKYIDSLKEGRSSGISSVFGRASDLLPADVLEIKPPKVVAESFPRGLAEDFGVGGKEGHINTNSDDETVAPDSSATLGEWSDSSADYFEQTSDFLETEDEDDEPMSDELEGDGEDSFGDFDSDDDIEYEIEEDAEESEDDQIEDDTEESEDDEFEDSNSDSDSEELTVRSSQGDHLWTIHFNRVKPLLITMADGSGIKNAEGRDETILALKTSRDQFKFFILSGLVIDPVTGNIYVEANDGAFTAAFMNNGWQIQQYRNHEGEETYYATEPFKPGRDRLTMQITNVALDPVNGEVSYDSLDGSASMTLKSRKLL